MFEAIEPLPLDPITLNGIGFRNDARPFKIDLGIGVYRNAEGRTPVMPAVKQAEEQLARSQDSKSYLGAGGNAEFLEAMGGLILGGAGLSAHPTIFGMQTCGGTGSVRLAMELVKRHRPDASVWAGVPAWPNYGPLAEAVGINFRTYNYFDSERCRLDMDAALSAIKQARPGDVLILQASCHNPTGVDPTADEWIALARHATDQGLLPLIDVAYLGLGDEPEVEAQGWRKLLDAVPEALIAVTCAKMFSLYRERTAALFAKGTTADAANRAGLELQAMARRLWSTPPDHGAAVVAAVLNDAALRASWLQSLEGMRQRVAGIRAELATTCLLDLSLFGDHRGLFDMLPIPPEAVERLKTDFAIYLPANGRINLAGLNPSNMEHFLHGLAGVLAIPEGRQARG